MDESKNKKSCSNCVFQKQCTRFSDDVYNTCSQFVEAVKTFNREKWIIHNDPESRYKNMRDSLKEMDVFKAFKKEEP